MAEYRGLTIRIGADASRFTAALKATQGAISDTQKNLNNLKKAMQMDPGSRNAAAMYVGELQSQAVAATSKIVLLKNEIEKLSNSGSSLRSRKGTTIGQLAEDTDNAALSARRAREAYNDVTRALAEVYTDLSDRSHKMFDVDPEEAKEYQKAWTQALVDANRAAIDERKEQLKQEQGLSEKEAAALAKEEIGYLKLADARKQAAEIVKSMSTGQTFNASNNDIDKMIAELERLRDAGNLTEEEVEQVETAIRRLKNVFRDYSDALDDANAVDQIHKDRIEVERLEAQIRSLAKEQVAASRNPLTDSLKSAYEMLGLLDDELSEASRQFRLADDTFKLDPTDVSAAAARMDALSAATDAAKAEAQQLLTIISGYEDAGIGDVVRQTENLSIAAAEAEQRYEDAVAHVTLLESMLDTTGNEMKEQRVDLDTQSKAWLDNALSVGGYREAIAEAKAEMIAAEEEHHRFQSALEMKDAINQYGEIYNKLLQFQNTARGATAVVQALAEQTRAAFANELEAHLAGSKEELQGLSDASKRASESLSQTERALQLDPANIDLIVQDMKAIDTASSAAEAELQQVKSIIDAYNVAGIDKIADSTPNLTQALADAREEARRASEAIESMNMYATKIDPSQMEMLQEALADASKRANEFESAQNLVEMRSRYGDIVNTIGELAQKADEARLSLSDMGDAVVDTLKGNIVGDMHSGFGQIEHEFEVLSDATQRAKTEFDAASKKLEFKPTGLDLAADRANALAEAISRATQEEEQLDAKIKSLGDQGFDEVLSNTRDIDKAMADTEGKWRTATQQVMTYSAQLAEARAKVEELTNAGKGVGDAEFDEAAADVDNLERKLTEAAQAANKFNSQFNDLVGAQTLQGLKDQRREVGLLKAEYESIGREGFKEMTTSLFLALQEIGQEARRAFNEVVETTTSIDDALTEAKKTVNDLNDEGFEKLKDSAIELSKVQPIDAATILNAEALGGQLGFAASEVEEFAKVATGLDVATNMSWSDAANNMARFFNIMDTGHDEVENYGSAIVALGNNFATTESEISDMAMRIAGAGASMGMSEADVLGLATALSSVGLSAEAGGSSISQIMVKIDKAVANATDGVEKYASRAGMALDDYVSYLRNLDDDQFSAYAKSMGMTAKQLRGDTLDSIDQLQIWAETAGMAADDFAVAWKGSPIEALQSLFSHMDQAAEEGSNLSLMLDDLKITTIRQSDVARRVANSSELLVDAVTAANEAYTQNTALSTEVERRNESLSAQMEILGNCFDAVKAELGEGLVPIVQNALPIVQNFSTILDGMSTSSKAAVLGITGLVGAFGTAYPALSQVFGALGKLNAAMIASSPAYRAAAVPVQALGTAIKALFATLGPTLTMFAALAAVVGGILISKYMAAKKEQDEFNAAIERMGSSVGKASESLDEAIDGLGYVDARSSRASKSISELTKQANRFSESQEEIETKTRVSAAMLDQYKKVIDEIGGKYAGAGADAEIAAEDQAKLEWALNGVNEELGTSIGLYDILEGTYTDEQGEIQNTIAMLDQLIDARKREARAKADQSMYTNAYENEQQALLDMDAAARDLKKTREDLFDEYRSNHGDQWSDDAIWGMVEGDQRFKEAAANYAAAEAYYESAMQSRERAENLLANDATLDAAEMSWTELYEDMKKVGIEAPSIAGITSDAFAQMVDACGGDTMELARMIAEASGEAVFRPEVQGEEAKAAAQEVAESVKEIPEEITSTIVVETLGDSEIIEDPTGMESAMERKMTVDVEVNDNSFLDELKSWLTPDAFAPITLDVAANVTGMDQIEALQGMVLDPLTLFVDADTSAADGAIQGVMSYEIPDILVEADAAVDSAISGLDSVTAAAGRVPSSTHTTAYANVSSALSGLWSVVSAANSIPSYKSVTVSFVTSGFEAAMSKIQSFLNAASSTVASVAARAASGGIRYHATGGIVDRPSWLGTRDIVGEAGAEAIIPLTNRKYVQPFADAVAEGMGKQLEPTQTVNNYYSINGLSVAPDSALARAMDDTFNEAKRYSRMGKR